MKCCVFDLYHVGQTYLYIKKLLNTLLSVNAAELYFNVCLVDLCKILDYRYYLILLNYVQMLAV